MAETAKTNFNETIKNLLLPAIPDIDNASKGEMSLFSPSKNLRVFITSAKTVGKSAFENFEQLAFDLKPAVALFVSCQANVKLNFKDSPCIIHYLILEDINERFIEYLKSLPNVAEPEVKPKTVRASRSSTSSRSSASSAKESKPVKASFIDNYDDSPEGFKKYCQEVAKSKIEFKKAVAKWGAEMADYPTLTKFTEHIVSLKEAKESKEVKEANGTEEEFNEYLTTTPASQIRKAYIKEHFSNLPDEITFLNETKDFQSKIRAYRKELLGSD